VSKVDHAVLATLSRDRVTESRFGFALVIPRGLASRRERRRAGPVQADEVAEVLELVALFCLFA
jgi:hypothetical protein